MIYVIFCYAVDIIGSDGTPYCGGIFKLDIHVPERYCTVVFCISKGVARLLILGGGKGRGGGVGQHQRKIENSRAEMHF